MQSSDITARVWVLLRADRAHYQLATGWPSSLPVYIALLIFELVLHALVFLVLARFLWVHSSSKTFHWNVRLLIAHAHVTALLSVLSRCISVMIVLCVRPPPSGLYAADLDLAVGVMSEAYNVLMLVCHVSIGLIVPERAFATWLVADYETKRRTWISIFLLINGYIFSVLFVWVLYTQTVYVLVFAGLLFVVGGLFYGTFLFLLRHNRRRYSVAYSAHLRERFQIAENVKLLRLIYWLLTMVAVYAFIFMTCSIILLLIDVNWTAAFSPIYATTLELCLVGALHAWRKKLQRQRGSAAGSKKTSIRTKKSSTTTRRVDKNQVADENPRPGQIVEVEMHKGPQRDTPPPALRTLDGQRMTFDTAESANVYFNQYGKAWG